MGLHLAIDRRNLLGSWSAVALCALTACSSGGQGDGAQNGEPIRAVSRTDDVQALAVEPEATPEVADVGDGGVAAPAPAPSLAPVATRAPMDAKPVDSKGAQSAVDTAVTLAPKVVVGGMVTDLGPTIDGSVALGLSNVGLGGAGTLAATTEVVISKLTATGELEALATTSVTPDGKFEAELDVEAAGQVLVAQAIDANGKVVGSGFVVVDTSTPGQVAITAESSVEVAIVLAAGTLESGSACEDDEWTCAECIDEYGNDLSGGKGQPLIGAGFVLDVMTQITPDVVVNLGAAVSAGLDVNVAIQSLASGFLTGRKTELEILAGMDIDVDGEAEVAAELIALQAISAQIAAAAEAGLDVDLDITADIAISPTRSLLTASNASPALGLQLQAVKDVALNGVVSGLSGNTWNPELEAAIDAMVFAQAKASADVESQALVQILKDILTQGGASQDVIDTVQTLGDQAVLDIHASADVSALAEAQAELMASLTGQGTSPAPTGDPLIDLLAGSAVSAAGFIDAGLGAVANFSASADAALFELVGVSLGVDLCIDANVRAQTQVAVEILVGALLDLNTQLQDLASGVPPVTGSAYVGADLVAEILGTVGVTLK